MKLVWRCESCSWSAEGSASGSMSGVRHQKWAKSQNEEHPIRLVDDETGELPLDKDNKPIRSLAKAQSLGLIPGKTGRKLKSTALSSEAVKGKVKPLEVDLDPRLYFFYDWDKMMVIGYEGNFSQWLWDCVLGFHIQNKDEFKLDLLFKEVS